MHAEAVLLVDDGQPQAAKRTSAWNRAWVPISTRACRRRCARGSAPRSRPCAGPDSHSGSMPSGSSQLPRLRRCCSASSSVGAISAAWCRPRPPAARPAPRPRSCRSPHRPAAGASSGACLARSAAISSTTRCWAPVSVNGSPLADARAVRRRPAGAGAQVRGARAQPAQRELMGQHLLEGQAQKGRMAALEPGRCTGGIRRRAVQRTQRLDERGQLQGRRQSRPAPIRQRSGSRSSASAWSVSPRQAGLLHALGGWVDRRQRGIDRVQRSVAIRAPAPPDAPSPAICGPWRTSPKQRSRCPGRIAST
jgi:hypothetical protein